VRLFHALRARGAGEAQTPLIDDALSFGPCLGQTGPVKPNIKAAGVFGPVAQFFLPGFLLSDFLGAGFAKSLLCKAASAAKGEFSSDLRGRGALPAE